jgi:hypothetical protein
LHYGTAIESKDAATPQRPRNRDTFNARRDGTSLLSTNHTPKDCMPDLRLPDLLVAPMARACSDTCFEKFNPF